MPHVLLRDLIQIPDAVHKSDFVISLADGIDRPEETVNRYVITDQLLNCFDRALGLIDSALTSGASTGAYLHGSFGSGKSHFMAVLHLLLSGDPHARSREELAPLLEKFDARLRGKKILMVPYHMIGARSMEAGVLGGYVRHIRRIHEDAPLPPVYLDDALLEEAAELREKMGDEAFFTHLGGGEDDGFGALAAGWDPRRFETALEAPPGDPERSALVSDYIDAFAKRTVPMAESTGEGMVPFDQGLDAISRHAKGLGYDAVLLFLDELILWFAGRMADPDFVNREGPKVAKLVEAPASQRPAPIISFIARQRDLREFVGSGVPGATALNFSDILQWWEGRFDVIELSDTNLRAIVEQRLLRPKGPDARAELDRAFDQTFAGGRQAMDTLMTSDADRAAFRRVYPFSPALIETLVAVSNYLQRERTALRLLSELLVQKRDELKVGDLVPIGDLYDVIRTGEDPFSAELKRHFVRARDLYEHRLRPLLLSEHRLSEEDAAKLEASHAFHTDDRLIKTLLLAALVADVGPLRNLTVRRLANLNHGTIRTPVPGAERAAVLQRLRRWAPDVPELRLEGDEQDPTVALRIAGVDVQAILDQASVVDNAGARKQKVREMLSDALGVEGNGGMLPDRYKWVWRGSRREADVQFANVRDDREIPDSAFRADDRPKVVIDFPFDEDPQRGPADDVARIQKLLRTEDPTPTVAWLPQFLTDEALERLGRLVVLDHVLSGDRLEGFTTHLSPQDRVEARHALENMRDSHREQVTEFLRQCYGIRTPVEERWVDAVLELNDQFQSLDPLLTVHAPTATSFGGAFEQILDQMMRHRYPAHPEFDGEVGVRDLRTCLEHIERAVGARDQRVEIPRDDRRSVRRVLGPLKLATTGESHIVLDRHWKDHFHRMQEQHSGSTTTVERLKGWMEEPKPRGLDDRVANLVVCAYALMDDRVLMRAGQRVEPTVDRLDPHTEIRSQRLPSEEDWETTRPRAESIFGIAASPIRSASNVSALVSQLKEAAETHRAGAADLVRQLEAVGEPFAPSTDANRPQTAKAASDLLERLLAADDVDAIGALAAAEVPTTGQALGRSVKSAEKVAAAIREANWELLRNASELGGEWEGRARALKDRVRQALERDEIAVGLPEVLAAEARHATGLLSEAARPTVKAPMPDDTGGGPPAAGPTRSEPPAGSDGAGDARELARTASSPDEVRAILKELQESGRPIERIELRIVWRDG